jgi:hypothetical protein
MKMTMMMKMKKPNYRQNLKEFVKKELWHKHGKNKKKENLKTDSHKSQL